jgi:hypothetical protein
MKKQIWYTIGVFKDGELLFPLRQFQLPYNYTVVAWVNAITGFIIDNITVDEGQYIAWDYEGRK